MTQAPFVLYLPDSFLFERRAAIQRQVSNQHDRRNTEHPNTHTGPAPSGAAECPDAVSDPVNPFRR
jgi:hypothetical protein